jgi:RimJ/RimL family protein N-acetyltransferase
MASPPRRLFKWELPRAGHAVIDANVVRWLSAQWQDGELVAWAECLPHTDQQERVYVATTGEAVPGEGMRYLATAQLMGGIVRAPYVVHVYVQEERR